MQLPEVILLHKKAFTIFSLGLILVLLGVTILISRYQLESASIEIIDQSPTAETTNTSVEIYVEVSGAVKNPGVYSFTSGARVNDALLKAGGISSGASKEFLSKSINRAQKLTDGQKIYIPTEGESSVLSSSTDSNGAININNAPQSQLESLPGIGSVTALKIINGRPYSDISDLLSKKIVSSKVFEQIKTKISLY